MFIIFYSIILGQQTRSILQTIRHRCLICCIFWRVRSFQLLCLPKSFPMSSWSWCNRRLLHQFRSLLRWQRDQDPNRILKIWWHRFCSFWRRICCYRQRLLLGLASKQLSSNRYRMEGQTSCHQLGPNLSRLGIYILNHLFLYICSLSLAWSCKWQHKKKHNLQNHLCKRNYPKRHLMRSPKITELTTEAFFHLDLQYGNTTQAQQQLWTPSTSHTTPKSSRGQHGLP